jgi:hypothetical protein
MSSSGEEAEFEGGEEEEEAHEEEAEEDDEDDVPLASLKEDGPSSGTKRKRKNVDYSGNDGSDEDNDEDDLPLSSLKKASPSSSKAKLKPKATSPKKKTKSGKAAPAKAAPTSSSKTTGNYASPSAALYDSESKKGMLIQALLCRWWYAMEWPDKSALPKETPKHYDKLNGFEGVYVCTSGGSVGKISDLRDKATCPSFAKFAKKSSRELKELLLNAMEEQLKQLIEHEGQGTATEKELKEQIKSIKKIKVDEADKEAIKVLKAAKMTL